MMYRISLLLVAMLGVLPAITHAQSATTFPSKAIRLILPYPPGGGSDTIARPLAQKLSENIKQQVIVD
ncbi:MAG TPA: tripartite tricarboxylate transporter substrate binding protein, partial [Burkholderiales bacterium]|nr:tripartite tricarboxylate transporter substrate binding protein [Burkholderiales bacterium]